MKQGCVAYKIAAHAADVALGIPGARDRDDELTKARAALNWEKHFELSFDPDTGARLPRRGPRRRHRLLRHVRPRLVLGAHQQGDRRVRRAGKDDGYAWEQPQRERRAHRRSSARSSSSAACSRPRRSTGSPARRAGRWARATGHKAELPQRPCRRRSAPGTSRRSVAPGSARPPTPDVDRPGTLWVPGRRDRELHPPLALLGSGSSSRRIPGRLESFLAGPMHFPAPAAFPRRVPRKVGKFRSRFERRRVSFALREKNFFVFG